MCGERDGNRVREFGELQEINLGYQINMLIGIDASRANDIQKTGVGNYAYFLIEHLKKIERLKDYKITEPVNFVLYTREPLRGELAKLPENWTVRVLRWRPLFGFAQSKMRLWTQVRLSWEMSWRAPDVLFVPAHVFPIIHPKKTVMTIHDIAALKFSKSYNWFERWYSLWSAKYAVRKLWKVIVPSESVKSELIDNCRLQISDCRINVIPHGFDERYKIETKTETENSILEKYNIKQPYILSIGRLEEKKNTARIVEAFNILKSEICNLQLVLVGNPGHGYEKVIEAINNSPHKQSIIIPGWVSEDDLPALMRGASVFVFPSLAEGFGMPILEAMAAGAPVVASRGGALEEVGGDACVYVDPLSVDEIAEAIVKLQNADFRMQNVERGLARVKDFSWEKCAEETIGCLMS